MPRLGRLKKRPEFLRVAGKGRKIATPGLVLQALVRDRETAAAPEAPEAAVGVEELRVGFTASRKVGKAVERNRARRRLRAAVAELMPLAGRSGRDYVVVARRDTLTRPWPALLEDLRTALARVETAGRSGGAPARHGRGKAAGRKARGGGGRNGPAEAKEAG